MGVFLWPPVTAALHDPALLPKMAPFFVLLAIWGVIFAFQRRKQYRQLRQEIDDLIALEKSNA